MEEECYDEFGNYIGPQKPQKEEKILQKIEQIVKEEPIAKAIGDEIVLHEDKRYYKEAEEVYNGVETLVMEEDTMNLNEPILPMAKESKFDYTEQSIPATFPTQFLYDLLSQPIHIRNIAIVGHFHHGKTSFTDIFVQNGIDRKWNFNKASKYTDTRKDEQERELSIKAMPLTMVLQNSQGKSYAFNILDAPGHPNFEDEALMSLRMADGALVVIDVIEGVMYGTERILRAAVREGLDIIIVINKMDRLVLELRLPPNDAFHKIKHTLEEVNAILESSGYTKRVSPIDGNVVFAASDYLSCFSLQSFEFMYRHIHSIKELGAKYFWGDVYYNPATRKFTTKPPNPSSKRTFVEFILEPFYKIIAHSIGSEKQTLDPLLKSVGIYMNMSDYKMDMKPLLRKVMNKMFGNSSSIIDACVEHIPNANIGNQIKLQLHYSGKADHVKQLLTQNELVVNAVRQYHKPNLQGFDVFGRVLCGKLIKNTELKILGEHYTIEEKEDMVIKQNTNLWLFESRFRIPIAEALPGTWVLIEGIDQTISKTATIIRAENAIPVEIMKPIYYDFEPYVKVSCEPLKPSELPKMLDALRKINKSYIISKTKVEESGEHILLGTGELYMDCMLHDLRIIYSDIEVKISDPSTTFRETVNDTSAIICSATTANQKNTISVIAQPLDKALAEEIELENPPNIKQMSSILETKYGWDQLTASSLWAFGPTESDPNLIVDYSISTDTKKDLLYSIQGSIIQGFKWATKEGPLTEEPVRCTKFKIIKADICEDEAFRSAGQIIPAVRKACHAAILMASPKMMEPMLISEIQCPHDCISAVYTVISKRRGHIISEQPKPGSPLYTIMANIPGIDSFGFETDLRCHTVGQAMVLSFFDHWEVTPGEPLDKTIQLKLLEPSTPPMLARDMMIKTRRRKGLIDDVNIAKYFDDITVVEELKKDEILKVYF